MSVLGARVKRLHRCAADRHPMMRPERRQPAARQAVAGRDDDQLAGLAARATKPVVQAQPVNVIRSPPTTGDPQSVRE